MTLALRTEIIRNYLSRESLTLQNYKYRLPKLYINNIIALIINYFTIIVKMTIQILRNLKSIHEFFDIFVYM